MAAAGQVTTGFSLPYVALYGNSGSTITYTSGQKLARGVSVSVAPETSDDNNFYTDNIVAETEAGKFTGGEVTLTVDGLFPTAEKLILGLPTASTSGLTAYGDSQVIPYVGIGFIVRRQSEGVVGYQAVILPKAIFSLPNTDANTQEETIDWQTQELSATCLRDDSTARAWKYVGTDYTTEAAAEAALQTKLNYTPTPIITT